MLYRKPWKLIMYSPTNNTSDELYKFVAKEVYKQDHNLLGVNADNPISNYVYEKIGYVKKVECEELEFF